MVRKTVSSKLLRVGLSCVCVCLCESVGGAKHSTCDWAPRRRAESECGTGHQEGYVEIWRCKTVNDYAWEWLLCCQQTTSHQSLGDTLKSCIRVDGAKRLSFTVMFDSDTSLHPQVSEVVSGSGRRQSGEAWVSFSCHCSVAGLLLIYST